MGKLHMRGDVRRVIGAAELAATSPSLQGR
jgi:hypothetical protein